MKIIRLFFLIVIIINCKNIQAQFPIPQLQAGVYINQTIAPIMFSLYPNCESMGFNSANFIIQQNLSPVVSGVELKLIVTQIPSPPDSAYTFQSGALHLGDTLPFINFVNTVFLSSASSIFFSLNIVGIPIVPLESYPCFIYFDSTSTICYDGETIIAGPAQCTVDNFNELSETNFTTSFILFPNPASEYIEISSLSKLKHETILRLFDSLGKEIQSELLPVNFSSGKFKISNTFKGLCFWSMTDQFGIVQKGKLIIQN